MKTKSLIIWLVRLGILLGYFMICYSFVNETIKKGTEEFVYEYFGDNSFLYLKAEVESDDIIHVYYKFDQEYYRFWFLKKGYNYNFIKVDKDVPARIK